MGRYYIEEDPNNPGVLIKRYIDGSYVQYNTAPIGTIEIYGGTTLPPGWLWCNGQAVSRSYYTFLFSAIGTTYGSGDGSTTFNVPTLSNFQPNMRFMIKSESTIDGHYLGIKGGGEEYADNPLGTILSYGGTTAPDGWFLCHGQALSRTEYSELFAVIGTSFGTGDGSTTFNLPDLRGEFLRGAGTNSHSGEGNGGTVGQHQAATQVPTYVTRRNTMVTYNYSDPSANNAVVNEDSRVLLPVANGVGTNNSLSGTDYTTTANSIRVTSRPTNTSVNFIIKAKKTAVPIDMMSALNSIVNSTVLPGNGTPTKSSKSSSGSTSITIDKTGAYLVTADFFGVSTAGQPAFARCSVLGTTVSSVGWAGIANPAGQAVCFSNLTAGQTVTATLTLTGTSFATDGLVLKAYLIK